MGSSKDRKPAKASAQKKTRDSQHNDTGRPWWQKPFVWFGGVFLTALAATLTGALQAMFSFLIGAITPEPPKPGGDPIPAVVSLKPVPDDVSLPRPRALSGQDLESLTDLKPHQQAAWLEKQGGIPFRASHSHHGSKERSFPSCARDRHPFRERVRGAQQGKPREDGPWRTRSSGRFNCHPSVRWRSR